MKTKFIYSCGMLLMIMISSCEDDFLELYPLDEISTYDYWKTTKDLKLYVNKFYLYFDDGDTWSLGIFGSDKETDNQVDIKDIPERLAGIRIVPESGGGWNFRWIREINYFFENYHHVEEPFDGYKHYVGEAHFFRALFYFDLLKKFGDVPYISSTLNVDSEELYAPRTPRQQVIDSIVSDLDRAIEYMDSGPNEGGTRLNKQIARLFKSRVCLYEGTWEKYHDGTLFGVPDPNSGEYLQMAADAALEVINSGHYEIFTMGDFENNYYQLFNKNDYSDNPEVMLWEKYSLELDKTHTHQQYLVYLGYGIGMTKSIVDDYLCSDGLPTAVSLLYTGDSTLAKVMTNRDPRLNQTVWEEGDPKAIEDGDTTWVFERSNLGQGGYEGCPTGYQVRKGAIPDPYQYETSMHGFTGSIYFRFAEALLNYAEARTELGIINQQDLDLTINILRDRVGMPHLELGNIANDPDWLFPELSPLVNEVRRERRIELACEGFRWDDLARWRAHELFVGKGPLGIRFDPVMYPDIEVGVTIFLNTEGYVEPFQKLLQGGQYGFDPNRDYLDPLPTKELTLNRKLVQNPGW